MHAAENRSALASAAPRHRASGFRAAPAKRLDGHPPPASRRTLAGYARNGSPAIQLQKRRRGNTSTWFLAAAVRRSGETCCSQDAHTSAQTGSPCSRPGAWRRAAARAHLQQRTDTGRQLHRTLPKCGREAAKRGATNACGDCAAISTADPLPRCLLQRAASLQLHTERRRVEGRSRLFCGSAAGVVDWGVCHVCRWRRQTLPGLSLWQRSAHGRSAFQALSDAARGRAATKEPENLLRRIVEKSGILGNRCMIADSMRGVGRCTRNGRSRACGFNEQACMHSAAESSGCSLKLCAKRSSNTPY